MSDYYTESQMKRIEQAAYDGAMLEAGKEWEHQRDESNLREHELESRIAKLETLVNELIKAGQALTRVAEWRYTNLPELLAWDTLVENIYKEREE
jgi:hypothetical protein